MGAAVLSDRVVRGALEDGHLHALAVTGLDLRRGFFICWDGRRGLPRPARALVEYLEMHAAALPA
jgi:DNA-binding transcriptional LysR family regulator